MNLNIGNIGIWGCGSPAETSAVGRSTDRADRRDRHYEYLKKKRMPTVLDMLMSDTLEGYLKEVNRKAKEMLKALIRQYGKGRRSNGVPQSNESTRLGSAYEQHS